MPSWYAKRCFGKVIWDAYFPEGDPAGDGIVPRELACVVHHSLSDLAGLCQNPEQQVKSTQKAKACFEAVKASGKRMRVK